MPSTVDQRTILTIPDFSRRMPLRPLQYTLFLHFHHFLSNARLKLAKKDTQKLSWGWKNVKNISIWTLRAYTFLPDQIKGTIHILMISETKIDDNFGNCLIDGFGTPFRSECETDRGGITLIWGKTFRKTSCHRKRTMRGPLDQIKF